MEIMTNRDKFVRLDGNYAGTTSIILGGIHGNELAGPKAFANILPNLHLENGSVWFGYGSPLAMKRGVRAQDTNLNRMFVPNEALTNIEKNSYGYRRAQIVKKYLDKADVLLDIHSSRNPVSTPFVICEPNGYPIAEQLPYDQVLSGVDEHEPGGTDYYMNKNGKIGICVETGYNLDPEAIKRAEDSIYAFLTSRGHIEGSAGVRMQRKATVYSLYKTKTPDFSLVRKFDDFESVPEGCVLGTDGDIEVVTDRPSFVLFASTIKHEKQGSEAFLLAEDIQLGTKQAELLFE